MPSKKHISAGWLVLEATCASTKEEEKEGCFLRETVTEGERKSEEEKKGGYFRGYGKKIIEETLCILALIYLMNPCNMLFISTRFHSLSDHSKMLLHNTHFMRSKFFWFFIKKSCFTDDH